ncbi:MAG: ErfK/YbiS/YcfS/YnhG family protein [Marmoricola sp.]|nr:ErfK/YbiS/YcfS/YnhG family protein [Marmoricola sp.]
MAASSAIAITLVTVLGGLGLLPDGTSAAAASGHVTPRPAARLATVTTPTDGQSSAASTPTSTLPDDTGWGKRVVFDISDQRVWLVDPDASGDDDVQRTYLVSGSLTDNLDPGTFEVYSRSRWAVGIDDSGVMEYFVRFTRGDNAAIGFHSIPTKNGRVLQTLDQLGTPQSHGCIRQALPDARRLWDFAPVGTKVVVTA